MKFINAPLMILATSVGVTCISASVAQTHRQQNGLRFTDCGQYSRSDQRTAQMLRAEAEADLEAARRSYQADISPFQQRLAEAQDGMRGLSHQQAQGQRDLLRRREAIRSLEAEIQRTDSRIVDEGQKAKQAEADKAACWAFCGRFDSRIEEAKAAILSLENEKVSLKISLSQEQLGLSQAESIWAQELEDLTVAMQAKEQEVEVARAELQDFQDSLEAPVFETFYQAALQRYRERTAAADPLLACQDDLEALRSVVFNSVSPQRIFAMHTEKMVEASELSEANMVRLLPEVSEKDFPIVTRGRECSASLRNLDDCDYVVIEILSSSEKATPADRSKGTVTDDLLLQLAREFNEKDNRTRSGKIIQIRVRLMASGTAFDYLSSGKYMEGRQDLAGLAYSPSNSLWVEMLESLEGRMSQYDVEKISIKRGRPVLRLFENDPAALQNITENMDGVVGNVAGLFVKKDDFSRLFPDGPPSDSCDIVKKVLDGRLKIGYTNPYVSSTGLNFLWTALQCLSPSQPTSEEAIASFRDFQRSIPATFETTLSMRDSVLGGGGIEAGVIEFQSFVNAKLPSGRSEVPMSQVFEFIPFGVRHDNPMAYVSLPAFTPDENSTFQEGLQVFAQFIASNRGAVERARTYGFFGNPAYVSAFKNPSGSDLITAQQVWKENKTGGLPIVAAFVADVSGSMGSEGRIHALRSALEIASGFVNSEMYVGLIEYANEIIERVPIQKFSFETRRRFVQAARSLELNGGTPLYEATFIGMDKVLEKARLLKAQTGQDSRMMIFVLTDGNPDGGISSGNESVDALILLARSFGVQIHTIGLGGQARMDPLREMSALTDGASLHIRSIQDLERSMAQLFNSQL